MNPALPHPTTDPKLPRVVQHGEGPPNMGDIILSVNGKEVAGYDSPHARLLELIAGEMRPLLFEFEKVRTVAQWGALRVESCRALTPRARLSSANPAQASGCAGIPAQPGPLKS